MATSDQTVALGQRIHEDPLLRRMARAAERWAALIALGALALFFSAVEPDAFATWSNVRAILEQSSVLLVAAVGVTVVLRMGHFDLSFAAVVGLSAAIAVTMMSRHGVATGTAIVIGLAAGAAVGALNGVTVAYLNVPSFIGTLAVGSIAAGAELATASTTIYEGLGSTYVELTRARPAGLPLGFFVALAVALALLALTTKTVFGRHATAIGDNPAAAFLAGVPTRRVVITGFMIAGVAAALAGILASSRAGSYYPGAGAGLLLPAYAAAFLGRSLGGRSHFNVPGTVVGVLLLATLSTGLTITDQPGWLGSVIEGLVLVAAIVLAGSARRRT